MFNPAIVYYPMVGEILHNRYQLLQILGSGAFGQTYLAQDTLDPLRSHCAIKHYISSPHYPHLLKTNQRLFHTEARQLAQLGIHPQIPQLLDHFEENHGFYLVQEYIKGMPLTQEFAHNRHNNAQERAAQAVYFLWDLLQILAFVHDHGVIHCDLKPNNLFRRYRDGKLVLLDFGAAQPVTTAGEREQTWIPFTTDPTQNVGYLAPEQLLGQVYANSDIYAAGVLTMQLFSGLELHQLGIDLQTNELYPIQWLSSGIAPSYFSQFRQLLAQMVRYDHQLRYGHAAEVLAELADIRDQVYSQLLSEAEDLPLPLPMLLPLEVTDVDSTQVAFDPLADTEDLALTFEVLPDDERGNDEFSNDKLDFSTVWAGAAPTTPLPETIPPTNSPQLIPRAQVVPLLQYQWHQPRWQMLARMALVVGALNALAIAVGAYSVQQQIARDPGESYWQAAQTALEAGDLEQAIAIAETIPEHSFRYADSQAAIAQWQQDWQQATVDFKAVQQAFEQQQWQMVLRRAAQLPSIPYWQQQVQPLVEQAQPLAEKQAKQLLAAAFRQAHQRQFTQALAHLYQIAPQTEVGATLEPKLIEYQQKQGVHAMGQLQIAYNLAAKRSFQDAIAILQNIPPNTSAGAIAQQKVVEYQQKAKLKAQVLARR